MDTFSQFKLESIDLFSESDLGILLDNFAEKICKYLDCHASSMFLYDALKEELYFERATGEKKEELKKIIMKKGQGIVGWVAENKKSVVSNNCAKDPRFSSGVDEKTQFITLSLVAVPVMRDNKFLGVLEAVNKKNGNFTSEDCKMLEDIAAFVSIPLQNILLIHQQEIELKEKKQLLNLGRLVSESFEPRGVLHTLREIISEWTQPLEINVMVKPGAEVYRLLKNDEITQIDQNISETVIEKKLAQFPLRVKDDTVGYLEIKTEKRIPEDVESLLRGVAVYAAIAIEKYGMYKQMLEQEKLKNELRIAHKIQETFLPQKTIEIPGLDIAHLNIQSSEVGGDYYDIIPLNPQTTLFTIDDITGHGIPASLLMAIFSANFKYRIFKEKNMENAVNYLNELINYTMETGQTVSSFSCTINRESMKLQYIRAGHPPAFLFRENDVIQLSEGGFLLGMFPGTIYNVFETDIRSGDVLILYTDGIVEAENPQGEEFGAEKLKLIIQRNYTENASIIKEKLVKELMDFVEVEQFTDDITFIIAKVL